jgi:hypothetical protein
MACLTPRRIPGGRVRPEHARVVLVNRSVAARPFDLGELFLRVDNARRESGHSWAAVSTQVGVAASTIRHFESAGDAEADGVLAVVGWLGVAPEEFIDGGVVAGEPLPPANGGFVRVDRARLSEVAGVRRTAPSKGRTTIQRLAMVARDSGQTVASLTRWTST